MLAGVMRFFRQLFLWLTIEMAPIFAITFNEELAVFWASKMITIPRRVGHAAAKS